MQVSVQDAFILRRVLAKMPPAPDIEPSPAVKLLLSSFDFSKDDDYWRFDKLIGSDDELALQITKTSPLQPPSGKPAAAPRQIYIPPLPDYARLSDKAVQQGENVGQWLKDYMKWSLARTPMTPPLFLEAGGLALLSMAVAGRVMLHTHDEIYPHLYILWIATTTRFAKSTGLKAVKHIVQRVMPHIILPEENTPEALIEILAGKEPENYTDLPQSDREIVDAGLKFGAKRAYIVDEASSFLGATRKDYMAGLDEIILKGFDAPPYITRNIRKSGLVIVRRPALSILGATAPSALYGILNYEKWTKGDTARYAMLFADSPLPYSAETGTYNAPDSVINPLYQLHHVHLPMPEKDDQKEPINAVMTSEALKAWHNYSRAMFEFTGNAAVDERLYGNMGRLATLGAKVALCLATSDWSAAGGGGSPVITQGHWAKAQGIIETWRESVFRLLPALDETTDARNQRKIEGILATSPSGLTLRDLSKMSGIPTKNLQSAIEVLVESGEIEVIPHIPPTGRPTQIYKRVLS